LLYKALLLQCSFPVTKFNGKQNYSTLPQGSAATFCRYGGQIQKFKSFAPNFIRMVCSKIYYNVWRNYSATNNRVSETLCMNKYAGVCDEMLSVTHFTCFCVSNRERWTTIISGVGWLLV